MEVKLPYTYISYTQHFEQCTSICRGENVCRTVSIFMVKNTWNNFDEMLHLFALRKLQSLTAVHRNRKMHLCFYKTRLCLFDVFLTVYHSIDFFQVTNLMHTSFIL